MTGSKQEKNQWYHFKNITAKHFLRRWLLIFISRRLVYNFLGLLEGASWKTFLQNFPNL